MTKKENKCKKKLIAENHLNKSQQLFLNNYIKLRCLSYSKVYYDKEILLAISVEYNFYMLTNSLKRVSISLHQAAENIKNFGKAIGQMS